MNQPDTSAPEDQAAEDLAWQRLDKWLWCTRLLRHRADCARLAATGAIRVNRMPTDKPHAKLRVGDVITVQLHREVRVLRVLALAPRRGPATEAAKLYRTIAEPAAGASATGQPCAGGHSPSYAATGAQGLAEELR